jgi:pyruvate,orthophosphate dikinase
LGAGMTHRYVYDFDAPPSGSAQERTRLLGGKGANLVVMANELALPVPPGFTITTEACRAFLAGEWPAGLDEELHAHLAGLGRLVGREFGDPRDPLLVSVRSGAPASMPGMMDTVLNLGLTDATTEGLATATGAPAFAADCLGRFRESYRSVIGVHLVPEDPWLQLRSAIEAVFRSWTGDRARAYRRREGIADDLGTAVTIQAMVFGNRGEDSGTGVVFTRNPSTGARALFGDVMFNAQGEDVVAGAHETQALAVLDERLPAVADELRRHADQLERHYADLCDIEFTIERGRLWLLQVRVGKRSPVAALRVAIDMAEDVTFPVTRADAIRRVAHHLAQPPRIFVRAAGGPEAIASGLPASPGVATGAIVTTSDAAEAAAGSGSSVILVRSETSPEDVRGMARSAGVLTARGGLASHAAVVARGWGIPAVVGASAVKPSEVAVGIAEHSFAVGDEITIDGSSGEIFPGALAGSWEATPEADQLIAWAAELGIDLPAPDEVQTEDGGDLEGVVAEGSDLATPTEGDLIIALLVRGSVTAEQLAESVAADPVDIGPGIERLLAAGDVERNRDALRPSSAGKLRALELVADDRRGLDEGRVATLLEEFHALDGRMKAIVTAWQVRGEGAEQTLNDHSDAEYDAGVLDDLADLDAGADSWLEPLAAALRRYAAYRLRLRHAVELARAGDQRYLASPRVDSYHSVWFELHEDLIRLAGRRREDEAATGRA